MRDDWALKVFGETVCSKRNEKQLSQEKLAEICELDRTYISSVERGQRNLSLLNILKIAKALGVVPSDLLN
jgi:transcriptional regulator with XRE-family HTH domain